MLGLAATLRRGYSITKTADSRVVRTVNDAPSGASLTTIVADGQLYSHVVDSELNRHATD